MSNPAYFDQRHADVVNALTAAQKTIAAMEDFAPADLTALGESIAEYLNTPHSAPEAAPSVEA
jgi:hypothetical protein